MSLLIPVVLLLAWSGFVGYRRYAGKKDLEQIQTMMQGRIRLAFGKDSVVSGTDTRHSVPQAWREPVVFAVRGPARVL